MGILNVGAHRDNPGVPNSHAAERRQTQRLSRVDGCPECLNYETPVGVADAAGGFSAVYACTSCGHAWSTNWKDE